MGKYFGTDGIRGRALLQFPPLFVFKLGMAGARILTEGTAGKKPRILIGKDTRISGDFIEAALSSGMAAGGCDVFLLGVIPTPGVAAMTRLLKADAAAMISASHNPYYDNGIKFFSRDGYKLPDDLEEKIERLIDVNTELSVNDDQALGRITCYDNAAWEYAVWLREAQSPDLHGLKLVVDTANGAASVIAGPLFTELGAAVVCIGNTPDGCNINLECGSTHIEALSRRVVEERANLGLAFDGDADRLLVIDEQGRLVDGDQLLAILARDMKEKDELSENEVVVTQMSNMGLKLAMEKLGIRVAETKVGDRYVVERMLDSGACIGGEQSGHIILRHYNSTGDGMVAALRVLSIVLESGKPISELAGVMNKMPQHMLNPVVKDKESWREDNEIMDSLYAHEMRLGNRGRILIRPSGTEPRIRIMAEGEDADMIYEIVEDLAAIISRKMN